MISAIVSKVRKYFVGNLVQQTDLDRLYDQMAGLLQVQLAMSGHSILRPLREWAISPDALAWFLFDLQQRDVATVIEFGSGQSTVVLASVLKRRGKGKVLSIEHDKSYLRDVRRQCERSGVSDWVEFYNVPVTEYEAVDNLPWCRSYEMSDLPNCTIDLALIDGPPSRFGAGGRYYPLCWVADHLIKSGAMYLDDSNRSEEQSALKAFLSRYPSFRVQELRAEKGLSRIYNNECL